jgi:hypothetical protein
VYFQAPKNCENGNCENACVSTPLGSGQICRHAAHLLPEDMSLLITHKVGSAKWEHEGLLFLESQRDSVPQPRVARTALPWETIELTFQPQRGCVLTNGVRYSRNIQQNETNERHGI